MDNNTEKKWKVLPLTLSLETVGGISSPLALRGTPLPLSRSQTFSTASDNQESVKFDVYLGESPISVKNKLVTSFQLLELPKGKRGEPQIDVKFDVSENLDLKISAMENKTKKSISIDVKKEEFQIDDNFIKEFVEKAKSEKEEDNLKLNQIETVNNANSIIFQAEKFIQDNSSNSNKRIKVEKALAELGLVMDSDNLELIREKTEELKNSMVMNSFDLFDSFNNIFGNVQKNNQEKSKPIKKEKSHETAKSNLSAETDLKNIGKIFGGSNFTLDPNLCFVLMPFSDELKPIYDDHISKIIKTKGLTSQRADEIYSVNLITWDIWEKINRARIIVADLTNKNPNVFYELGLAHAIGKEVIIISQKIEYVPFDLKALRCIIYEYNPRGIKKLEDRLSATIDELLRIN